MNSLKCSLNPLLRETQSISQNFRAVWGGQISVGLILLQCKLWKLKCFHSDTVSAEASKLVTGLINK